MSTGLIYAARVPLDLPREMVATRSADLDEVEAEIHDCPFTLDEVALDPREQVLTVPFMRFGFEEERVIGSRRLRTDYEFPWVRSYLRVNHALGYRIDDGALIGSYTLLGVRFDDDARRVLIEPIPDLQIAVDVARLEVRVQHTDHRLGTGRRSARFGGLAYTYDRSVHR